MALPTDVQTGTVTGKYTRADGTPEQGSVTFTPTVAYIVSPVTKTTVTMDSVTVTLAADGTFSAVLIASGDNDVVPTDWTWAAGINITGRKVKITTQTFVLEPGQTLDITGITTVQTSLGTASAIGGGGGPITTAQITDATATGVSLVKATDGADARSKIGAGTSSLVLGTAAGTARAGNIPTLWAEIPDRPSTFTPSSHVTYQADIIGATTVGRQVLSASNSSDIRNILEISSSGLTEDPAYPGLYLIGA